MTRRIFHRVVEALSGLEEFSRTRLPVELQLIAEIEHPPRLAHQHAAHLAELPKWEWAGTIVCKQKYRATRAHVAAARALPESKPRLQTIDLHGRWARSRAYAAATAGRRTR